MTKSRTLLSLALFVAVARSGAAATAATPAEGPDSPAAERATFTVADGFDVELFASEADGVAKPIQIRFDARGRLWVVGSTAYPQIEPGQVPDDKILILEDTDRDGRSDKTTVFADKLMIPTGLELTSDGGAYVGHGTQLLFLKDTDGDGKADQRRVVMRGFGTGDSHQNINSFMWGPGGELWMCQGLSVRSRVETPWGIVANEGAGLWRLYPARRKLEPFYGGEFEPQNPWGYVFTEWGEPIVIAGNNSSPIYAAPGLVPNRKGAQPPMIWRNGGGRKCSGADIVGTTAWPKDWQGALVTGGYINNAVWSLKLSDDGAGFAVEDRAQPLITSSSTSFRPVDAKFGPDGALYLCDWYNPIIGHYQASFRDPRRDKTRGRIWRVTAKGRPLTEPPKLVDATIPQLLDHLKSTDRWTRHFAKRVLADRPTKQVLPELRRWSAQAGIPDLAMKEALGVCQSHEAVEPELLARLCAAGRPGARAYAAGVVGAWADRLPDPLALLRPLVADAHPRVRLQAVVACAYVPKPEAVEVAMVAADHPTDPFIDYAIGQTVHSLKPHWAEALRAGKLNFGNNVAHVVALVKADGTPDTLQALRALVGGGGGEGASPPQLDAGTRETFLNLLAEVGDANDLAMIVGLDDPALKARLIPALAQAAELRELRPAGDLPGVVTGLLSRPEPGLRAGAMRLAGAWRLADLRPAVEGRARDAGESPEVRRAAITALPAVAGGDAAAGVLADLSRQPHPPAVRAAAVAALATLDAPNAAAEAASLLADATPDADAELVLRALLKRADGPAALLAAVRGTRPTEDAAKIALRVMNATGAQDEALAAAFQDAAGLAREPKKLDEAEVAALAEEVRTQGDAARGAQVFARAEMSCTTCHAVNGKGAGRLGPDLGNLGTAQTTEFIIGALLDPNREVKEGYVAHEVVTTGGDRYQAYVVRENHQELVIRDVAQDKELRLRKDGITRIVQRGSVMPPGLTDTLTRAELRDLVRYLGSLGNPRAPRGNDPAADTP
jgi:putative heme-binding domain-containing protein